jgi:outer membrane protein OmpA-like peptidoglycan-associated protein
MKNLFIYSLIVLASLKLTAQTTPSAKHLIKYLEINTTQSDYGLAFLDNDKVVFAMPIDENSKGSQSDLFVGDFNDKGEISNKELVKGIRQLKKVSKTGVAYSHDLKTVYFSAKKDKRKKSKEKDQLFKANIDASGNWINVEKLPFNNDKYSTGQPTLSNDDKQLYFVSNRPSSNGGNDIFVVTINDDGTYSEPKNLGKNINTHGDEITPYITDNNILYFSSNGREGSLGDLDVYASQIIDNSPSEPIHLEAPINSINNDFAYIINKNNNSGYFSSNRLQGQDNNDIYSFILEEPIPEKCLQEIAGIVKDKETDEVLNDAAMTLFDEEGNQVQQIITDSNGAYKFTLDCNQTYTLIASSLYYVIEEHIINTANYNNAPALEANKFLTKKSGTELEEAIAATAKGEDTIAVTEEKETPIEETKEKEEPVKETIVEEAVNESEATINPVYFGFDQSNITDTAAIELDKVVAILSENTTLEIEVSAYTDSRGSSAYNIGLSNRRAKSSVDYLVSQGIDRNRIKAKGYGESRMINKCVNGIECSEAAHAKNRRTEFVILNSQTYNEPVKNDSNESLSSTNNKRNITKNKEETVAKHLYNKEETDNAIESVVSKNQNNLSESTKNQLTSLNDESTFSETDKNEELTVDSIEGKKNENITENKETDNANELVVSKSQNDPKESTENQLTSLSNEPRFSETEDNKDNTTNNVVALSSSDTSISQTNQDKSNEISKDKSLKTNPRNKPLVNDKNQISLVSNNLIDDDNNAEELTDKLVTQVNQKTAKEQSDTSSISLNDKSQANDNQIASNQLLKKKLLTEPVNNNSLKSKRISEEDIPNKPEETFNKDLSKATNNIKAFSNLLNEEENETNDKSIEQKTKEIILPGKIEKNAPLKTGTVDVSAMRVKRNGNYAETGRAINTHAISVNFKMYKNKDIAPGHKEIFIVIQNPQKKVINERGTFTLRSGKEMPYTDETTAYYNGRNIKISILSDRFIQKMTKGTYIVQVYIERYLTGQTLLVLS